VHRVLDAVSLMQLLEDEDNRRVGGVGQAPFAPSMLLALLIHDHSHGVTSSRAIERLCRRDAGYRSIVCGHVPDHTVIACSRRRHVDRVRAVFATVLRMCRDAGLIRLGLVVLDGTKVKANASLEANRSAATIDEQVRRMLAETESTDQGEDRPLGPEGRERLPPALLRREDRLARLAAAAADADSWSEENAASQTEECAMFAATRRDRTQRAELREAALPRGRMSKGLAARQRLQRGLRTKRVWTIHAKRGASVGPVSSRMNDRQSAGGFCRRGLGACRSVCHVHAAVQTLRTLHRASVRRRAAGGRMYEKQENRV
jgi:transposase